MIKSLRLSLAFVTSLLAGLAMPQAGSAQFFDRPQFFEPILPIDEILFAVEERGFEPISRPRLRGDVYLVEVIDRRGLRTQLSVDAYDGVILGSVRPRGVLPAPVYRDARPVVPFGGRPTLRDGYEERFVPDRSVRDLRDPSTRGSSVRIETVPARRDSARAAPALPEATPLPPPRPPEVAMAPALPRGSDRAVPAQPKPSEPAALPRADERGADEQARERPVRQATEPPREPASRPAQEEPAHQAERQAPRDVEQQAPRQVERMLRPHARSLLDDFSPDERDQLDMYPSGLNSR